MELRRESPDEAQQMDAVCGYAFLRAVYAAYCCVARSSCATSGYIAELMSSGILRACRMEAGRTWSRAAPRGAAVRRWWATDKGEGSADAADTGGLDQGGRRGGAPR